MIINICLLMATLSFSNCDKKQYESYPPSDNENISVSETKEHLTIHSTIADVLTHPAFDGFSRYILPLEWGGMMQTCSFLMCLGYFLTIIT